MKYGNEIVEFLRRNQKDIVGMCINGDPSQGYLRLSLANGEQKIFANWDEEDQGLFAVL